MEATHNGSMTVEAAHSGLMTDVNSSAVGLRAVCRWFRLLSTRRRRQRDKLAMRFW